MTDASEEQVAMSSDDNRSSQARALGAFIRAQREVANLSLRATAERAGISNPYLSQLERGLHEPSIRVLTAVARALHIPADEVLNHAGLGDSEPSTVDDADATAAAIRRDPHLTPEQRDALLGVYRSYRAANERSA